MIKIENNKIVAILSASENIFHREKSTLFNIKSAEHKIQKNILFEPIPKGPNKA